MKRRSLVCLSILLALWLSACGDGSEKKSGDELETTIQTDILSDQQTENDTLENTKPMEKDEEKNMENSNKTVSDSIRNVNKILIVYFSLADIVPEGADASAHATPTVGNTESAAIEIQKQTGGDLFAIKTVQAYPVSHRECSKIAEEEMKSDARPELSTYVENIEDYNTIYIGFPIWWYQEPMAIRTFLETYDLSGKTILPFCTTLGAGVEESEENIHTLCPDAEVQKGLTLYTEQDDYKEPIEEWLSELGMINKN